MVQKYALYTSDTKAMDSVASSKSAHETAGSISISTPFGGGSGSYQDSRQSSSFDSSMECSKVPYLIIVKLMQWTLF